jgi:hypothetical protein
MDLIVLRSICGEQLNEWGCVVTEMVVFIPSLL